jgi:hypothetical protein
MKIAAMVAAMIAAMSACAKPARVVVPPKPPAAAPAAAPAAKPSCFAPAGNYMAVAGLTGHTCPSRPSKTLLSLISVERDSIPCGVKTDRKTMGDKGTVTTTLAVKASGMGGLMVMEFPGGCAAVYELGFVRLK